MSPETRRAAQLVALAALGCALTASAAEMAVPRVGVDAPVSALAAASLSGPTVFAAASLPMFASPLPLVALSPMSLAAPSVQIAAQPLPFVALSPLSAVASLPQNEVPTIAVRGPSASLPSALADTRAAAPTGEVGDMHAVQGQSADELFDGSSNHSTPAPTTLLPSEWKHLSRQSVDVLRALRSGGLMSGYSLMANTGLDAGQLRQALQEISAYPLSRLTTPTYLSAKTDVGDALIAALPSAVGTIDLFGNKTWSGLSPSSLTVLRALRHGGLMSGYALMSDTGLDQGQLGAALTEIVDAPFPLVSAGNFYGPKAADSLVVLLPSQARFVDALLAYRR